MKSPVVVILFNRPDNVAAVMKEVAKARPSKLFLAADGPRASHPGDADRCAEARAVAEGLIDWDCEVFRDYAEENLGCARRPSSAISWALEHVEQVVILEDDCVPDPSFFEFCDEMLDLYRDDERVMHVSGCTYRTDSAPVDTSYYFSQFVGCWGWATWRRAWQKFDFDVRRLQEFRETGWLEQLLDGSEPAVTYWYDNFSKANEGKERISFWDYQWAFACWSNNGLGITPRSNLIRNVGCGDDATHTFDHPHANLPAVPLDFPLRHPALIMPHWAADREFFRKIMLPAITPKPVPLRRRLRSRIGRLLPESLKRRLRPA